jgi:hypothetical protein
MTNSNFTRPSFTKRSAAISAATALSSLADSALSEEKLGAHWKASLEDPVRHMITGQPHTLPVLSQPRAPPLLPMSEGSMSI